MHATLVTFISCITLFSSCLGKTGLDYSEAYPGFGTKTSYFVNANPDTSPIIVPGCEPAMFWFLARHGTRNPGKNDIKNMTESLPAIRDLVVSSWQNNNSSLDQKTIEALQEWTFDFVHEDNKDDKHLTQSGGKEHQEMGARWRKRLDTVLSDKDKVHVRSTKTQRTRESAKSFLKGVFGEDVEVPPSPDNEDDILLKFNDNCVKYTEDVYNNTEAKAEMNKLEKSPDYVAMITEVSERCGVDFNLSHVDLMWNICWFEMAWWNHTSSPWCNVFSENNLKIIEFREDLKYYYQDAYAYEITQKMTNKLFQDIFSQFSSTRAGNNIHTSALYLAHSETLQPFLAGLGLFHDPSDLLASDWPSPHHLWRTSQIASFASNAGLVLLQCQVAPTQCLGEECWYLEEEWRVMALHQERRVVLPACGEEICGLDKFMEYYRELEQLDFKDICTV